MTRKFHIAYIYNTTFGFGFGRQVLSLNKGILITPKELDNIQKLSLDKLKEDVPEASNLVITSWQEFECEVTDETVS